MGRWLAIDYGKVRCGLAVTDPLRIIANGLATVATKELTAYLLQYMAKETVERIVVGLPTQTNGRPSENLSRVKSFVSAFSRSCPHVPIVYYDERFTSVLAHRAMIDGGLTKSQRRDKALVDEISATILLQSYMESVDRI